MNETNVCKFCNGYYDFGGEHVVCSSCHAFIYEFTVPYLTEGRYCDEKEASNDSGNEEPDKVSDLCSTGWSAPNPDPTQCNDHLRHNNQSHSICPIKYYSDACLAADQQNQLKARNYYQCDYSHYTINKTNSNIPSITLEDLPTEILLNIFLLLDDLCLWSLRQASSRCQLVIDQEISDQQWESFVRYRWPLFTPNCRIDSWRLLYLNLMESVTCRFCLERLRTPIFFSMETPTVRFKRIKHEFENLCADPPYGIKIISLDTETYSQFLAGIEGPPQSPYQGGFFNVVILVPDSYPFRPPVIRFLTRILHPNISFHGDVGLDSIRHNWCLSLSLEKLLISILALLTDPHTRVCMEPVIGALYDCDRFKFEELAKLWTWKFACHDYLSADFVASMVLPSYIKETKKPSSINQ